MTRAAEVIRGCRALLLDFDGPVCTVFAGHPAGLVASSLHRYLDDQGIALPDRFADNRDPLKLLQWVGQTHPPLTQPVEDLLIAGETAAAESSSPTAGAAEVIEAARRAGWPIGIVSNNSAAAISTYLSRESLTESVAVVVGRPYGLPARMKPEPDSILVAAKRLGVAPESCVLVGDSPTDMQAAGAAGARSIGYVKALKRRAGLIAAGADACIADMRELLATWVSV